MALKDLFVTREEPEQETPMFDPSVNYQPTHAMDVDVPEIKEEGTFVKDAYQANEKPIDGKSIFKVEELLSTLPNEMPTQTKLDTILGILGSFGLEPSVLSDDGRERTEIIESVFEKAKNEILTSNKNDMADIEDHKQAIESLQQRIASNEKKLDNIKDECEKEIDRIKDLINFLYPVSEEGEG